MHAAVGRHAIGGRAWGAVPGAGHTPAAGVVDRARGCRRRPASAFHGAPGAPIAGRTVAAGGPGALGQAVTAVVTDFCAAAEAVSRLRIAAQPPVLRLRGNGGCRCGGRGLRGAGGAARGRAAAPRRPRRGRGEATAERRRGPAGPAALRAGPAAVRGRAAGDQVRPAEAPAGGRLGGRRRLLGGLAAEAGRSQEGPGVAGRRAGAEPLSNWPD